MSSLGQLGCMLQSENNPLRVILLYIVIKYVPLTTSIHCKMLSEQLRKRSFHFFSDICHNYLY